MKRRFEDPHYLDFLMDNKLRFTLLVGLERIIAIRQAQPFMKERFMLKDSFGRVLE